MMRGSLVRWTSVPDRATVDTVSVWRHGLHPRAGQLSADLRCGGLQMRVPELSRLRGLWENQHPVQSVSSHLPEAGVGRGGMRMDGAERRRREFIRVNHPDRGGDPDVFIAGMRSFGAEAGSLGTEPLPRVVVVSHRSWLTRLAIAVAQRLRHGKRAPRVR